MNRRDVLKGSLVGGAMLAAIRTARGAVQTLPGKSTAPPASGLSAGFAREKITPPLGTRMMGFGGRDFKQGCQGIHDDLFVRALFLEHRGERALILAYDLCFVGRAEADRFKGALGREFDLLPRQILINTSHNHAGPAVGTWYWSGYLPAGRLYIDQLERATLQAARRAHEERREVTLSAGIGETQLPMSRRKPDGKGDIAFAPNPDGVTYRRLPVCRLEDHTGKAVCLLFSVSAHPSMALGWEISADYPGVACRLLDEHLGTTATMFLQGSGADANTCILGTATQWQRGTWDQIEQAGRMVAREAIAVLNQRLRPIEPVIHTAIIETHWPLQPAPSRSELEAIVKEVNPEDCPKNIRCQWATRQLTLLGRGTLPTSAGVLLQVMQFGPALRLVGLEGEPVAEWGRIIEEVCGPGVTFPLGYSNGQGLYLPVSSMISEGGYEVVSSWEYGYPAMLATGMEEIVLAALGRIQGRR